MRWCWSARCGLANATRRWNKGGCLPNSINASATAWMIWRADLIAARVGSRADRLWLKLLRNMIQQKARTGEISDHVAMKYLVPVARAPTSKDCQRMADAFRTHRLASRQAGQLYAAWRDA